MPQPTSTSTPASASTPPPAPSSPAPQKPRLTRHIIMAALSVYLTLTMTVLDGNIVNVALPTMAHDFGVSRATIVWVENSYLLIITMLLLPLAALGDLRGYKRVFLWGVGVFTAGSALCSVAKGFPMLIGARVLEGLGAAGIMSVNLALIRFIYPPQLLGRGLAWNAVIVGGATALGPTLSGAILSVASWHWLFVINIPIGVAALWVGLRHLPDTDPARDAASLTRERFDKAGALESALLFGLFIMVMEGFSHAKSHWLEWAGIAAIIILAIILFRREKTRPVPLLPIDLFRRPDFMVALSASMVNFISTMLAMVSLPFFLKQDLGYDVLHVGLLISPWPIALIVASLIAGRLVCRVNASVISAVGMGIAAIGLGLLWTVPADGGFWAIAWRMAICGLGFGLFKTPNNVLIIRSAPVVRSGAASGIKSTARLFGQSLGTALVALIFRTVAAPHSSRLCLLLAFITAIVAGLISLIHLHHSFPRQCIK